MSILDLLLGLFGGPRKVDLGRVSPDDLDAYWKIDREVDQAERKGDAALAQVFSSYGIRDRDHFDRIKGALHERHGQNPEFKMGAARVGFEVQMREMAGSGYQVPAPYLAAPHGVTLDRYASIQVRLEGGEPAASVYASYQLDEGRWREAADAWAGRMGPDADLMAGNILRSQLQAMRHCAAAAYGAR
jgi:hypothetical protein